MNGIVACLYEYLNLSPEYVNFQKVRLKYMQVLLALLRVVLGEYSVGSAFNVFTSQSETFTCWPELSVDIYSLLYLNL